MSKNYLALLCLTNTFAMAGLASPVSAESFLPSVALKGKAFVEELVANNFTKATSQFDATMSKALPPAKLSAIWRGLQAKVGAFRRITNVRTEAKGPYQFAFVTCAFKKLALDAKVVFSKSGKVTGLFFVPTKSAAKWSRPSYARPASFDEREVKIGTASWRLPGTLSVPKGGGPFPAVVLVHGSGPNSRDESVGGIRVFKDIAWGLASNGIAVLRYDKRTLVHGKRMVKSKLSFTINEETVDDAVSAVAFLRKQRVIDAKRVYVLGHSLGAMIAPRIGRRIPNLAGLVLLAGNTRPTPELIVEQVTYLAKLDGKIDEAEKAAIRAAKKFRSAALSRRLKATSKLELFGQSTSAAYWLDLRDYKPTRVAAKLRMPMFIGQGKRDYQVTVEDFRGWKKALSKRSKTTFRLYPALNHLFVPGKGRSTPAEYQRAGNVDPKVIDDVLRWIKSGSS